MKLIQSIIIYFRCKKFLRKYKEEMYVNINRLLDEMVFEYKSKNVIDSVKFGHLVEYIDVFNKL